MTLSKIAYVILFVPDPEKTGAWYRDTLGCKVTATSPEWVEIDGGGVTLALHGDSPKAGTGKPAKTEVVFAVDDVHAMHATLRDRGVVFVEEPRVVFEMPGAVGKSAVFRDPDGHMLSIFGIVKTG